MAQQAGINAFSNKKSNYYLIHSNEKYFYASKNELEFKPDKFYWSHPVLFTATDEEKEITWWINDQPERVRLPVAKQV